MIDINMKLIKFKNEKINLISPVARIIDASDPPGELKVLDHDSDPFGVNGTVVGVLHEPGHIILGGKLHGIHGLLLPPELVIGDIFHDGPDESPEIGFRYDCIFFFLQLFHFISE